MIIEKNNIEVPLLQLLTEKKEFDFIKKLINFSGDINARDSEGNTALMYVAKIKDENVELIKELIQLGANVNITNNKKNTAVMHACLSGNYKIVKELIKAGANLNLQNTAGETALMLLVDGYECNKFEVSNALQRIYRFNNEEKEYSNILNKYEISFDVKEENINKNIKQYFNVRNKRIEELISYGADINLFTHKKYSLLMKVSGLEQNSETNDLVKILIKNNVDVNFIGANKATALSYFTKKGNREIIKELIEAGADVNLKDKYKESPLRIAITREDLEVISKLIDSGADINEKNISGYTPLMQAILQNSFSVVGLLLSSNVNIDLNIKNKDNQTALDIAKLVSQDYVSLIENYELMKKLSKDLKKEEKYERKIKI